VVLGRPCSPTPALPTETVPEPDHRIAVTTQDAVDPRLEVGHLVHGHTVSEGPALDSRRGWEETYEEIVTTNVTIMIDLIAA